MKYFIFFFLVFMLFASCISKQTKYTSKEREIDNLVERLEHSTKDGCYGGMTQIQIERLLYLTSPKYQDKLDEKTKAEIEDLLYRIRESKREEKWEDEEDREDEDREEEFPD